MDQKINLGLYLIPYLATNSLFITAAQERFVTIEDIIKDKKDLIKQK